MFLHENFCSICERTTAHMNGQCMTCSEKMERGNYDSFRDGRESKSIEERLELIEKWIYENQRKLNTLDKLL